MATNRWENMRLRTKAQYAPQSREIDGPWAALREQQANSGGFSSTYNPETMDPRQDPRVHMNLSASTQGWDAPSRYAGQIPKANAYEDRNGVMATNARLPQAQAYLGWGSLPSPAGMQGDRVAPLQTRLQSMEAQSPSQDWLSILLEGLQSGMKDYR